MSASSSEPAPTESPGTRAARDLALPFDDIGIADVSRVGGKNASLGELTRELHSAGVAVPEGFATTVEAYRLYIEANSIRDSLADLLAAYRAGQSSLRDTGAAVRELFLAGEFPPETATAIRQAYRDLAARIGGADGPGGADPEQPAVAVRISAIAPFRFPHEERGIAELIDRVQRKAGREALGLGWGGLRPGPQWRMKRDMLSPRATTQWDELLTAKAG